MAGSLSFQGTVVGNLLAGLVEDGIDVNTDGELNGHDLADALLVGEEVDGALVDLHLVGVPGVGTVTARGLTGGVLEGAGGETHGAADGDLVLLGAGEEVRADLLDSLGVGGGEGDVHAGDVDLLLVVLLDESHGYLDCRKDVITLTVQEKGNSEEIKLTTRT